jgi:hypothetical protein
MMLETLNTQAKNAKKIMEHKENAEALIDFIGDLYAMSLSETAPDGVDAYKALTIGVGLSSKLAEKIPMLLASKVEAARAKARFNEKNAAFEGSRERFREAERVLDGCIKKCEGDGFRDLSGEWVYLGSGVATIVQEGNRVRMKLTWTPSSMPGPHYEVDAALSGNAMTGVWRLISEHDKSSTLLRGGRFQAEVREDGDGISVSNTEDNGHGWNRIVLTRRPIDEEAR